MKKRIIKWFLIAFVIYAVFALICIILFNAIRNNPIDKISMTYLRHETDIPDIYGEIIHIGRNIVKKTEKSETVIRAPYGVETERYEITVYVTLEKADGEWKAVSYEVIKVITLKSNED